MKKKKAMTREQIYRQAAIIITHSRGEREKNAKGGYQIGDIRRTTRQAA